MTMPRLALAAIIGCAMIGGAGAMPFSPARSLPSFSPIEKVVWVCGPDRCWWQGPGPAPGPAPVPGAGPGPGAAAGPGPEPGSGPEPGPEPGPGPGPRPGAGRGPGGPCAIIRAACLSAGFVRGGARAGNGVQMDCIRPIIEGRPPPPRTVLPLPRIDPQIVAGCRAQRGLGGPPPGGAGERPSPGYGQQPPGAGAPVYRRPTPGAPPPGQGPPPSEGPPQGSEPPPPNGSAPGNSPDSAPPPPPGNPAPPGGPPRVND
jgi:hypothetical protein